MKMLGRMVPDLLGMLVKRPATVNYPHIRAQVPAHFRGALRQNRELCIGCKICEKVCPSHAIVITKLADKQFKATVHLDKCIYCGQCVDSCPKKCLENTQEFELATLNKDSLTVDI